MFSVSDLKKGDLCLKRQHCVLCKLLCALQAASAAGCSTSASASAAGCGTSAAVSARYGEVPGNWFPRRGPRRCLRLTFALLDSDQGLSSLSPQCRCFGFHCPSTHQFGVLAPLPLKYSACWLPPSWCSPPLPPGIELQARLRAWPTSSGTN